VDRRKLYIMLQRDHCSSRLEPVRPPDTDLDSQS
jgi:hypothetical protein